MSRTIWVTWAHLWTSLSFHYYLQIRGGTPLYRLCLDQGSAGKGSCDSFCAPATTNRDNIFFPAYQKCELPCSKDQAPREKSRPSPCTASPGNDCCFFPYEYTHRAMKLNLARYREGSESTCNVETVGQTSLHKMTSEKTRPTL